ncbi:uncharacterized protein VTP21DRAFT_7357 [Calcarisporiella thermophila]|uniref:uncharacterized protein n=1 Tax=Calcarisporiella thermophila TaxID=911321 RepID=UPI00374269AD
MLRLGLAQPLREDDHNHVPIDLLAPFSSDPPPSQIPHFSHPSPPQHYSVRSLPIPTNKFYENLLLPNEGAALPVWTHPYVVRRAKNGIGVCHTDEDGRVYGPNENDIPVKYFYSPYRDNLVVGAKELNTAKLSITDPSSFSVRVWLHPENGFGSLTSSLVRGMAFLTIEYDLLTPVLSSEFTFEILRKTTLNANIDRYYIELGNKSRWVLYVIPNSNGSAPELVRDGNSWAATRPWSGVMQAAKLPLGVNEEAYDKLMGVWTTAIELQGSYTFDFKLAGDTSRPLLHFTLPHHRAVLSGPMRTDIALLSTTMGDCVAYVGNKWTLTESNMPSVEFLPDSYMRKLTPDILNTLREQARKDIYENWNAVNQGSIYFSGKALQKYALLCLVTKEVLNDKQMSENCISKLKAAFQLFVDNKQTASLAYDTTWKGVVRRDGIEKNLPNDDFGNSWYNDHHFHYSHLVYTSALLLYLDPSTPTSHITYTLTLIRDVANPSSADPYFPVFRNFDWWVGHSWASGLFPSADGMNEESTSEDINFLYAMKLFGTVLHDRRMRELGDIMLAVQKRSLEAYVMIGRENTNMPVKFRGNRIAGITFENKVDYATYFSPRRECIHGIHMLPMTPIMTYMRSKEFVNSEWDERIAAIIDSVSDGWKSILYLNLALANTEKPLSYFLHNPNAPLDDGLSRTWALFWAAVAS